MRHKVHKAHFGRKQGPRIALMRGLVNSLVEHGRIRTTLPKAKELRRHVEKAITVGKSGTVHNWRTLLKRYPNQSTVKTIMTDLAPRFSDRMGGYTRILKLGPRAGDGAPMAFIEFVDYTLPDVVEGADTRVEGTEDAALEKKRLRAYKAKKKRLRTIKNDSRKANRN